MRNKAARVVYIPAMRNCRNTSCRILVFDEYDAPNLLLLPIAINVKNLGVIACLTARCARSTPAMSRRRTIEASYDNHNKNDVKEKRLGPKKAVNQHLTIDGDKERFKELLRRRLMECGWRDEIRILCRDTIRERGVHNVTVDEIVDEVTPKGRALVPDTVKKELLQKIKSYLYEKANK